MNILVTGGAGYIGSHTVRALLEEKYNVIVYDNLSTGHKAAIPNGVRFIDGDIHDKGLVARTCREHEITAVVHFAASSLVAESMKEPAKYYHNNVAGTLSLMEGLRQAGVNKIVFSSTAAVYGEPEVWPITEDMPTNPTNVYGRTKLVIESLLKDFFNAYGFSYVSLRYFNAAGAYSGGIIGEDHTPESHLIPLVMKTALGLREAIDMYGTDYPTHDGTCIRDYIHVMDLADAHVLAVKHLLTNGQSRIYNLGSEHGYSVREVVEKAKIITGRDFATREMPRRAGDPAVLVASSEKIKYELGWNPKESGLENILKTAWNWHKNNPYGYNKRIIK